MRYGSLCHNDKKVKCVYDDDSNKLYNFLIDDDYSE
jgi:hypothetical protein